MSIGKETRATLSEEGGRLQFGGRDPKERALLRKKLGRTPLFVVKHRRGECSLLGELVGGEARARDGVFEETFSNNCRAEGSCLKVQSVITIATKMRF